MNSFSVKTKMLSKVNIYKPSLSVTGSPEPAKGPGNSSCILILSDINAITLGIQAFQSHMPSVVMGRTLSDKEPDL